MKKQFLLLAFFTLAILAGTNTAWGQTLPIRTTPSAIDTLSCVSNALPLHPVAGIPFTYRMDGTSGEELTYEWTWFATKDTSFIGAGGLNLATRLQEAAGQLWDVSANYATATVDADSVVITWTPEILALTQYEAPFAGLNPTVPSPTFVVAYANGINCADNIEVYEIAPVPSFVVDIANITEDGTVLDWGVDTAECVDVVRSAKYNDATKTLEMDYGADTLYFEVVAANFVTSWTPYFSFEGLQGSQEATIGIAANYADAQSGTWITGATPVTLAADGTFDYGNIELTAADAANLDDGVSFVVRVVIDNNTYESLTSTAVTVAVAGQDFTDQWDIDEDDCADPTAAASELAVNDDDDATQHVRPRPTIEGTPDLPGTTIDNEPVTPVNPEDVINKERN